MRREYRRLALLVAILVALLALFALLTFRRPVGPPAATLPGAPRVREVAEAPVVAPAPASPAEAIDDVADHLPRPFRADQWVLSNGMTAIVVADRSAPTVATRIVVRAGAAHDPPGHEGTAHLLEHLMFGGTSRLGTADWPAERPHLEAVRELTAALAATSDPEERAEIEERLVEEHEAADIAGLPNEVLRALDALGATDVNASTGLESTSYFATLPANALEPWALLETERFADPVFRSFVSERRVVEAELGLREMCGTKRTAQEERAALFAGHPYAAPIGGTPSSLAAATVDEVDRFFARHYVPGNMAVVVVGDLDPAGTFELLDETLGALPAGPVPSDALPIPRRGHARELVVSGSSEFEFEVALGLVGLQPGDLEAIRVAAGVLASGLRGQNPDGFSATASVERLTEAGVLRLRGRCKDPHACVASVRDGVRSLADRAVSSGTLRGARANAWVDRIETLERQDVQAEELASAWVRGEDPGEPWRELVALHDLDPNRVAEVVRRVLEPADLTATIGPPLDLDRSEGSATAKSDIDDPRTSAAYDAILAVPVRPPRPAWREEGVDWTRTDDGRVVAVRNPSNTLFEARLSWPIGLRLDDTMCAAVNTLVPPWGLVGGDSWVALREVGVEIRPARDGCDWAGTAVVLKGPGAQAGFALRYVLERFRAPDLERVPEVPPILRMLWNDRGARFWFHALHGPDALVPPQREMSAPVPPLSEMTASLRTLAALPPDIRYSGPHDAATVAAMIPGGRRLDPDLPDVVAPVSPRVHLWNAGANLIVARVGEPYDPDHEGLYALYERWLGGPTGLVSEALRLGEGTTYASQARLVRGRGPGEPNVTRIDALVGRGPGRPRIDVAASARTLGAVLGRSTLDDARWARVRAATEVHTLTDWTPFREAAVPIGEAVDRGLTVDANQLAWEQLPEISKARFEAFVAAESARPPTFVISGSKLDPAKFRSLGEVSVVRD